MGGDLIAEGLDGHLGEVGGGALEFLQRKHIGLGGLQPIDEAVKAVRRMWDHNCPADGGEKTQCIAACRGWAETSVSAEAGAVETLFQDATVATQRCRADVRFDIAYDGGQVVASRITYLVKSDVGGVQVALSQ